MSEMWINLLLALSVLTVTLCCADGATYTGSGIVIGRQGEVLTAAHVVKNCKNLQVSRPLQRPVNADVVAKDTQNDLALLRAKIGLGQPALFRAGTAIRAGESVMAIGYPLAGLLSTEPNLSTGVVSASAGLGDDVRYLQVSVPVQPGNSGGPLLDGSGHVVGVVSGKLDFRVAQFTGAIPENVNFAIKSEMAQLFLRSFSVSYQSAPSTAPIPTAAVADVGKGFTVFVTCRNAATVSEIPASGPHAHRARNVHDWTARLHPDWFKH